MQKYFYTLSILFFAVYLTAQETIHCWDFNAAADFTSPISTDHRVTGNGSIEHNITDVQNFQGNDANACVGSAAGNAFCPRPGALLINNDAHIDFIFPTTGYEGINFSFWFRRTGAGFNNNVIEYSTNGGTTYTELTTFNFGTGAGGTTFNFDFSAFPAVNNNPNFRIRIILKEGTDAVGNNRYDNVKLEGTACAPCTGPVLSLGWQITDLNIPFIIDFDNTIAGVNEGAFAGAGFSPNPDPGQLNSNAFITGGWSDAPNNIGFGAVSPTSGDFARGVNSGATGTGGIYGFDVSPGNRAFGFKPSGPDFTPGFVTLRLQNQAGQPVGGFELSYNLLVFNNGNRSNFFNFSYSLDNVNFTSVAALDYISPLTADGSPSWQSNMQSAFIEGFVLNPGQFFYLRWDSDDVSGSGSRDAFALDDIEIVAIARLDLIVPTMGEWALMILGILFMIFITGMVKAPHLFNQGFVHAIGNLPYCGNLRKFALTGLVFYLAGLFIAVVFFGGFGFADLVGGLIFSQLAAYWLYVAIKPVESLLPQTHR